MLTKYLREFPRFDDEGKLVSRGTPIGCVVALDEDHIGVTICNPCDHFDKEYARNLAIGRAYSNTKIECPNRVVDEYWDGMNKKWRKVTLDDLIIDTVNGLKNRIKTRKVTVDNAKNEAFSKTLVG